MKPLDNNKLVKDKVIDDAIRTLKSEFIGIDDQIDEIMNVVRVWYVYPELQQRPCVVNVFGMSGCGKTSLIKRIAELLDMMKHFNYYNFANINERSSLAVESEIFDDVIRDQTNTIFVYDEFQYAATIDEGGSEKDNKNGLKPFWELLDTGKLHQRTGGYYLGRITQLIMAFTRISMHKTIIIKDGVWENIGECFDCLTPYEVDRMIGFFKVGEDMIINKVGAIKTWEDDEVDEIEHQKKFGKKEDNYTTFFLANSTLGFLLDAYNETYGKSIDIVALMDMLLPLDYKGIYKWLCDFLNKLEKGQDVDFHNSIIFVVANLDEAYTIAFNVNPDMSPDQFHAITKKISVVDIKQALQKRFRNEQIARLGNTHIIYPSFNSNAFKALIDQQLGKFAETAKGLTGMTIEFDHYIKKAIYNEAVYPTHGTRPVFSTVNEIIKSKLPLIVSKISDDKLVERAESLVYSFNRGKTTVKVKDIKGDIIATYRFQDKWRLQSLRENHKDESQANTAVHESGHFVIYTYLYGKLPEKVVSRSADQHYGGFMMSACQDDDVESSLSLRYDIRVALAGYVAEKLVFGKEYMSSGASSDIEKATNIAGKMLRMYGFGDAPIRSTVLMSPQLEFCVVDQNNNAISECIKKIINEETLCVENLFKRCSVWNMFVKSSQYLTDHPTLPKTEMEALYNEMSTYDCTVGEIQKYSYKNHVKSLELKEYEPYPDL